MPTNPRNFNIDNVRVVKIMGGSLASSRVVQGMVFGREPESEISSSSHLWDGFIFTIESIQV
jgi:T-complex protein 1 subunit theta